MTGFAGTAGAAQLVHFGGQRGAPRRIEFRQPEQETREALGIALLDAHDEQAVLDRGGQLAGRGTHSDPLAQAVDPLDVVHCDVHTEFVGEFVELRGARRHPAQPRSSPRRSLGELEQLAAAGGVGRNRSIVGGHPQPQFRQAAANRSYLVGGEVVRGFSGSRADLLIARAFDESRRPHRLSRQPRRM